MMYYTSTYLYINLEQTLKMRFYNKFEYKNCVAQ